MDLTIARQKYLGRSGGQESPGVRDGQRLVLCNHTTNHASRVRGTSNSTGNLRWVIAYTSTHTRTARFTILANGTWRGASNMYE